MPSPLGHGLAAAVVHTLMARGPRERRNPWRLAALVGVAVIADVDLLFKYVDGRPHHQGMTHSIGFTVLAGLAAYGWARFEGWARPWGAAFAVALAYGSHVLLDLLGRDTHPPIGLRALWPIHDGFFKFPQPVFLDIGRNLDWATLVNNVQAGLWEIVVLAPITWIAWRYATRKES